MKSLIKENCVIKAILLVVTILVIGVATKPYEAMAANNGMIFTDGNWRYMQNGKINYNYTGMACNELGWWYFNNGLIDWDYTGMACNEYGWWFIYKGKQDPNYTGMACNEYGWWYFRDGQLDWNYTGMALNEYGWWYFNNGQLDLSYTGMACNEYGWWYFENGFLCTLFKGIGENEYGWWYYMDGRIDFGYTGTFCDINKGWVFVRNGMVDRQFTGIAYNENGCWYFKDGKLVAEKGDDGNLKNTYTGMACDQNGKWLYLKNGKIDETFTGMALNEYGWWYYNNGTIDFSYTGVARNDLGAWYYSNGQIDFGYNGTFKDGVVTYAVNGGKATATESSELLLGVFFNSREDSTDTLYVSFDGYEFYSIGEAFTNINNTVEEDDLATCSPSLVLKPSDGDWYTYYKDWNVYTQRDPSIFYKDGYFWMTGTARGSGENAKKMMPMLAYSSDLINWSYPCAGHGIKNWNLQENWLLPSQAPPATNASGGYDAVAGDAFLDDDGTVWIVVSTGVYADTHSNNLAPYLIKVTDLSVPDGGDLSTIQKKLTNSDFYVNYGDMVAINLPLNLANMNKTWTHGDYDYDGSIFKRDGKYYYVVQHSGEIVQLWSIDSLDRVSDPNAWTMVNPEVLEGSEGPCIALFNGKNYLYTDRYPGWKFYDSWGDNYGIFATTADTLENGKTQFTNTVRITTRNKNGIVPNRHGSVIKLTDSTAIQKALNAYHAVGY